MSPLAAMLTRERGEMGQNSTVITSGINKALSFKLVVSPSCRLAASAFEREGPRNVADWPPKKSSAPRTDQYHTLAVPGAMVGVVRAQSKDGRRIYRMAKSARSRS